MNVHSFTQVLNGKRRTLGVGTVRKMILAQKTKRAQLKLKIRMSNVTAQFSLSTLVLLSALAAHEHLQLCARRPCKHAQLFEKQLCQRDSMNNIFV